MNVGSLKLLLFAKRPQNPATSAVRLARGNDDHVSDKDEQTTINWLDWGEEALARATEVRRAVC